MPAWRSYFVGMWKQSTNTETCPYDSMKLVPMHNAFMSISLHSLLKYPLCIYIGNLKPEIFELLETPAIWSNMYLVHVTHGLRWICLQRLFIWFLLKLLYPYKFDLFACFHCATETTSLTHPTGEGRSSGSRRPGPWFNIKMSYQYRKYHCGDKTVIRSSYLHNGISYTGKMTSLYWIGAQYTIQAELDCQRQLAGSTAPHMWRIKNTSYYSAKNSHEGFVIDTAKHGCGRDPSISLLWYKMLLILCLSWTKYILKEICRESVLKSYCLCY